LTIPPVLLEGLVEGVAFEINRMLGNSLGEVYFGQKLAELEYQQANHNMLRFRPFVTSFLTIYFLTIYVMSRRFLEV
jgi:hypothetical protein